MRERVVVDGTVVTAAGLSSGIDMARTLLAEANDAVTAQTVQLAIEYARNRRSTPVSRSPPLRASPNVH